MGPSRRSPGPGLDRSVVFGLNELLNVGSWFQSLKQARDEIARAAVPGQRSVLAHRDLHDGQFLVDGGTIALLDFDLLARAEPELDVANLLEHVLVIDQGRIIIDEDADTLRGSATTVVGTRSAVDAFVEGREILHRDGLGGLATVTVAGLDERERAEASAAGLELGAVSLQQLIIRLTNVSEKEFEGAVEPDVRQRQGEALGRLLQARRPEADELDRGIFRFRFRFGSPKFDGRVRTAG